LDRAGAAALTSPIGQDILRTPPMGTPEAQSTTGKEIYKSAKRTDIYHKPHTNPTLQTFLLLPPLR
jgi:hypothetical protein